MLQANELRIGNWVECPPTDFYKYIMVTKRDFRLKDFWENCNPIPLTPEILEKAGFEDHGMFEEGLIRNGKVLIKNGMVLFSPDDDDYFTSLIIKVSYLHQLQNLYFALTGTELNINL